MSRNIHGLSYDNPNDRPFPRSSNEDQIRQQQLRQQQQQQQNSQQNIFGMSGTDYPELNKVLAPNFSKKTFIFWITILQIIVFIAELLVGQFVRGAAFCESNTMGGPSVYTLKYMGGKYVECIQNGEVYRFITPALLHAGIIHIFTNLISQTMIGYTCEYNWGFCRMFGIYFATAFGATLLSCVGRPYDVSVGASGALLGVIGCYLSWILLNWNNNRLLPAPCARLCSMLWWLLIIFMIGIGMKGIDNFAHLGGFISGIFIGFSFNTYTQPWSFINGPNGNRIKYFRILFTFLTIAYFTATLLSTFFAIKLNTFDSCWAAPEKDIPSLC